MRSSTFVFNAGYALRYAVPGLWALSNLLGSCTTTASEDAYAAAYGYPLDGYYGAYGAAYDGMYADDWGYAVPLPAPAAQDAGTSGASDAVSALRAIAMGNTDVCPGQATIEPQKGSTPCGGGSQPGEAQIGVKITFNGCQLQGGGKLDGSYNVTSTHTASDDTCSSSTTIHVTYTAQFSNLAFTASSGRKIVIASMNDSGTYDHTLGAPPTTIKSMLQGHIQRYAADGSISSDRSFSGQAQYTVAISPLTLTVDASFNMTTAAGGGGSSTLQLNSLKQDTSCCYPTSGSISASGSQSGTYTFGPSCGQMTKDSQSPTMLDPC